MSLDDYRKEIDILDEELLKILSRRHDVLKKVGAYKKANHLPALDLKRKQQVLKKFETHATLLGLNPEFSQKLYELIHDYAIQTEEE